MSWVTSTSVLPAPRFSRKTSRHFCGEGRVTDGEHFVDQHDVGVGLDHDGEGEPDHHPRRVVLELEVDELPSSANSSTESSLAAASRRPSPNITPFSATFSRAVKSGLNPTPNSMNGASRPPSGSSRRPPGRCWKDLQQRALARAVAPHDPEELTPTHIEGDPTDGPQLPRFRSRERVHDPFLQGVDLVLGSQKVFATSRTSMTTGAEATRARRAASLVAPASLSGEVEAGTVCVAGIGRLRPRRAARVPVGRREQACPAVVGSPAMIAFGCSMTSPEIYARWAKPGVDLAAEPDSEVYAYQAAGSLFRSYNLIMEQAATHADLEALVLVHQDCEIVDPGLCAKVRRVLADPKVGVVGAMGVIGARSIAWWEASIVWAWTLYGTASPAAARSRSGLQRRRPAAVRAHRGGRGAGGLRSSCSPLGPCATSASTSRWGSSTATTSICACRSARPGARSSRRTSR